MCKKSKKPVTRIRISETSHGLTNDTTETVKYVHKLELQLMVLNKLLNGSLLGDGKKEIQENPESYK